MKPLSFISVQGTLMIGITALALSLSGCIIIPIPKHGDIVMSGHAPSTNAVAQVRTNVTTKATVLDEFGQPAAIWEDERIFVYSWNARSAEVFLGYFLAGGYDAVVGGGAIDAARPYALYVQFDEQDCVRRIERVTSSWTSPGSSLASWAKAGDAAVSERSASAANKCLLLFRLPPWTVTMQPFSSRSLAAGIGTFESMGIPQLQKPREVKSNEEQPGWCCYELPPGTYYIGLQDQASFKRNQMDAARSRFTFSMPRSVDGGVVLRTQVCGEDKIVYAGTVRLACSVANSAVTEVSPGLARVEDESAAAREIAAKLKPGATLKTELMKPHSGPYILRTPGALR